MVRRNYFYFSHFTGGCPFSDIGRSSTVDCVEHIKSFLTRPVLLKASYKQISKFKSYQIKGEIPVYLNIIVSNCLSQRKIIIFLMKVKKIIKKCIFCFGIVKKNNVMLQMRFSVQTSLYFHLSQKRLERERTGRNLKKKHCQ